MKANTTEAIRNGKRVSLRLATDKSIHTGTVLYVDTIGIAILERAVYKYLDPYPSTFAPERDEMRLYTWASVENVRYGFIWDSGKVTDGTSVNSLDDEELI